VGEKAIVQYQNTGTPKPLVNPNGMQRSVGKPNTAYSLKFDCQNGIARKRERRAAFTTDEQEQSTMFDQQGASLSQLSRQNEIQTD
jgi:hypothetical protein